MRFGNPGKQSGQARFGVPSPAAPATPAEARPSAPPRAPQGNITLPEAQVIFDPAGGHAHTGTDSHTIDHANLANVTANQHHAQAHALDGADHTLSGATAGHLLVVTSATSYALQAPGTQVIRAGTAAARPAASAVPAGTLYLSTDDDGGTLHRSTGSAWVQCGLGVTESPSGAPAAHSFTGALHTISSAEYRIPVVQSGGTSISFEEPGTTLCRRSTIEASDSLDGHLLYRSNQGTLKRSRGGSTWEVVAAPPAAEYVLISAHTNLPNGVLLSTALGSSGKHALGAWGKENVSLLGTTDEEIFNAWSKGANDLLPRELTGAGTLKAISVTLTAAITGGGSATFTVYKNGSSTGLTVTISGAAVKARASVDVSFVDEDLITVFAKRTGTISNTPTAGVVVEGVYDP